MFVDCPFPLEILLICRIERIVGIVENLEGVVARCPFSYSGGCNLRAIGLVAAGLTVELLLPALI